MHVDTSEHKELAEEVMDMWKALNLDAKAVAKAMGYPIHEIYAILKKGLYFESMEVRKAYKRQVTDTICRWWQAGKTAQEIADLMGVRIHVVREAIAHAKTRIDLDITEEQSREIRDLMQTMTVEECAEAVGCTPLAVILCVRKNFSRWYPKRDKRAGGAKPVIGQKGVMMLRNLYRSGAGLQAVKDAAGITYQTARELVYGEEAYAGSGPVHPDISRVKPKRGFARGEVVADKEAQAEIRQLYQEGHSFRQIALITGFSRPTVRKVVFGYRPYESA